jgi:anti-sigma regulatory factor (Ser/Thr protein kinase)
MTAKKRIIEEIWKIARKQKEIRTQDITSTLKVSRQFATRILGELVKEGVLIKMGSTKSAVYVPVEYTGQVGKERIKLTLKNTDLKEHEVLTEVENQATFLKNLDENIASIFAYAFSEMLNNAIEHSQSKTIEVEVTEENNTIVFIVNDFGIGVFRNVMQKHALHSELDAIQEIMKGKLTTQPQAHSGEGIFFTSKAADIFILESYDYRFRVDNTINDVFVQNLKPQKKGTRVIFCIPKKSKKHLNEVFGQYQTDPGEYGFDKTEIKVKLYTLGTIYVSRSQARRVLAGLEKFKSVILDFDKVPTIGQAFADEIFRVFASKYPEIKITPVNMNEAVEFMVKRVNTPPPQPQHPTLFDDPK